MFMFFSHKGTSWEKSITHNIGGRDQPPGRPALGVTAELRAGRSRGEWERDRGDVFRATKSRKLLGDPELTKFSRGL